MGDIALPVVRRWPWQAWVPVAAGGAWLWYAASFGPVGFVFSVVSGCLLLASGVSVLLYPGDLRIPQFTALGGVLGVPLAVPALFVGGPITGAALIALSAASFLAAGSLSVALEPPTDEVPDPAPSLRLAAEVAVDEAVLATLTVRVPMIGAREHQEIREEVRSAIEFFEEQGWLDNPAAYHEVPPDLREPVLEQRRLGRIEYEHLTFESGYAPRPEEPGAARWTACVANRTAHAWILRRGSGAGPWLVCIHGYEMGRAGLDIRAFGAHELRERGLNVALPVLPLHGPRRRGRFSGEGFLGPHFVDTVHAEAQAMWDIRRILSWIRTLGGGPIGVMGLSLGGYNTALLAALEAELAVVVAGIPATDFTRLTWRHAAPLQIRYAERYGVAAEDAQALLRVVSPLALPPLVAPQRRFVFAGVADRLVPPDQPRDLWRHWDRPRAVWYQGGHLTFWLHSEVRELVRDALRVGGLVT